MSEIITYSPEAGGGWSVIIDRAVANEPSMVHTVDVGDTYYRADEVTHYTRDDYPMVVRYRPDMGYVVNVHTGEPYP